MRIFGLFFPSLCADTVADEASVRRKYRAGGCAHRGRGARGAGEWREGTGGSGNAGRAAQLCGGQRRDGGDSVVKILFPAGNGDTT